MEMSTSIELTRMTYLAMAFKLVWPTVLQVTFRLPSTYLETISRMTLNCLQCECECKCVLVQSETAF